MNEKEVLGTKKINRFFAVLDLRGTPTDLGFTFQSTFSLIGNCRAGNPPQIQQI